jgi:hypothetical protein
MKDAELNSAKCATKVINLASNKKKYFSIYYFIDLIFFYPNNATF